MNTLAGDTPRDPGAAPGGPAQAATPAAAAPAPRPARALAVIWLMALTLLALVAWHTAQQIEASRGRELRNAQRDLANLTRVSQEHAERTLRSADQVLRFVRQRYAELGSRLDLAAMVADGTIDAVNFPQIGVIDPDGVYALANLPITRRIDLSDREHFRVHTGPEDRGLFVSAPVLGRASGKWSIQLTRRITRADGGFGGVAVLSLDPSYFTRFYGDLALGRLGVAALVGVDGIARARRAGESEAYGSDLRSSQLFTRLQEGQAEGVYVSRSPLDGHERLLHFRRLERFPMAVAVGLALDEVLANHRRTRQALLVQGAMVSLLVLALAAALTRYVRHVGRELERRRVAQQQLHERNEQINAIFALSPDGFVAFDASGSIVHVNPAFAAMSGAAAQRLLGMTHAAFDAWLGSVCVPHARWNAQSARQALDPSRRTQVVLGAGLRVLQVRARESGGATRALVLYFRDVTHETQVDEMKSEFLSTAAHELRTPMASVYGFAEVLLTHEASEAERREYATIIHEQAGNMTRILDELLDLARLEARRGQDFAPVALELHAQVSDILRAFRPPQGRQAPRLSAPQVPLGCRADPGKLRQALLNVLSNAYKYSPQGGPVEVSLSLEEAGGAAGVPGAQGNEFGQPARVCIAVRDHGIGMSPEQRARVFERFWRADSSGSMPGTGLGMSIVKEIFERMGGEVSVESAPGRGTTVRMLLPGVTPAAGAAEATAPGG